MNKRSRDFSADLKAMAGQMIRIWKLLLHEQRRSLLFALVIMAVVGAVSASIPVVLGRLVDSLLSGGVHSMRGAVPIISLLALAYLTREGLQAARKIIVERTCTSTEKMASVQLAGHLFQTDLSSILTERVGALHGRFQRSVDALVKYLKLGFLDFLPAAVTATFALAAAIAKHAIIGGLMAIVVPVGAYIIYRQLASQRGIRLRLLRTKEEMDGTLVEQLSGIEYVRAANTHEAETTRMSLIAEELRVREFRHHIAMAGFDCAKALNEGIFHIAVITTAIGLSLLGTISAGDILTFSLLFASVITPLREVHRVLDEAHESSLRVADLFGMLAEPVDRSFMVLCPEQPGTSSSQYLIEAREISAGYPTRAESVHDSLKGVSFSIASGGFIGIAGPSGSGKSTLVKVLMRLVHPRSGTLLISGARLENVTRETLSQLIAYVGQVPFLFSGTIAENIAYGCGRISDTEIQQAAVVVGIHDEIMEMPHGYDTPLWERGGNLAGGQKQRIAIARAILKNAPILVLDEATSALDSINESKVLSAIHGRKWPQTVLLIAHRLNLLETCDRILVLDGGRIVEDADYKALLSMDGVFSRLVKMWEHSSPPSSPQIEPAKGIGADQRSLEVGLQVPTI